MSEMQFEDQQNEFGGPPVASEDFDMSGKLITWGIASSRQQAEYVLIGIAILAAVIAGYLFWGGSSSAPVQILPIPGGNE